MASQVVGILEQVRERDPRVAQTALLKKNDEFAKAESSLTDQIRTEKIDLAHFLYRRHVLAATSPACNCGWNSQTAKHIIRHCRLRSNRQRILEEAGPTDYRTLATTLKGLKASLLD